MGKRYKVGFSDVDLGLSFQKRVCRGALKQAEQMGIDLDILDARGDLLLESGNMDAFLEKGVDAVIVAAVDYTKSAVACRKIADAKKPVVTVADAAEGFIYVGSDRVQGGGAVLTAETMVRVLAGTGNIIYICGKDGITQDYRDAGFREVIRAYPQINVLFEKKGRWDFESGFDIMREVLEKYPSGEFRAVFAHNDDMALGALAAVKQAGGPDPIHIFGIDGSPLFLDALEAGDVTMTAFQNAELIGSKGVETVYALLSGWDVPYHIPVEWEAVDAGNVKRYKERWNEKEGIFSLG